MTSTYASEEIRRKLEEGLANVYIPSLMSGDTIAVTLRLVATDKELVFVPQEPTK